MYVAEEHLQWASQNQPSISPNRSPSVKIEGLNQSLTPVGLSNFGLQTCGTRWQPDSPCPPLKAWLSRGRQARRPDVFPSRRPQPPSPPPPTPCPSPGRRPCRRRKAAAAPPQAPTRLVIHYTGLCDFVWSLMS